MSAVELKFCINCKFYQQPGKVAHNATCSNPKQRTDLVTGVTEQNGCAVLREGMMGRQGCGISGDWYEARLEVAA